MPRPHINDIINPTLLRDMIDGGYIRTRHHDTLPLTLYSYTEKAQYESVWNDATMQCRGLIVDHHGTIHARPWGKFFNSDQPEAGALDLDATVEVTDKLDGSLGIGWLDPIHGFHIATRGSFHSEQAQWAKRHYSRGFRHLWTPQDGYTYLFEIVYPQNRIVLDYGRREDLVLLGIVDTATGFDVKNWRDFEWPGGVSELFPTVSLRDALAMPPRTNAEGLVVRYVATDHRVKIKQADYVALHKLVTGLTERGVWEALAGNTWQDFISAVPDEFHAWCNQVSDRLSGQYFTIWAGSRTAYLDIVEKVGDDRKAFAMEAAKHPVLRPYLFMHLDGHHQKLEAAIWKAIRPSGDTYMNSTAAEENAA